MSDISRRAVLRALTAGAAGGALLPLISRSAQARTAHARTVNVRGANGHDDTAADRGAPLDMLRVDRVGLQLYTVRASMAKDLEGTIGAIAAAGVSEVEFAGYYERTAEQWRTLLKRHNLTAPSAHIGLPARNEEWKKHFDMANALGHRWVVVPSVSDEYRGSADKFKRLSDRLNEAGRMAKAANLRMAYHNHDFEFAPLGKTNGYEVLMSTLDPALVDMELDLYWVVKARQDPLAMIARWPGRFQLCHIKDAGMWPFRTMKEAGAGTIDFGTILSRAKVAGFKHWYIEFDHPTDDVASVTRSSKYLRALAPGGKAVVDTMPHF